MSLLRRMEKLEKRPEALPRLPSEMTDDELWAAINRGLAFDARTLSPDALHDMLVTLRDSKE